MSELGLQCVRNFPEAGVTLGSFFNLFLVLRTILSGRFIEEETKQVSRVMWQGRVWQSREVEAGFLFRLQSPTECITLSRPCRAPDLWLSPSGGCCGQRTLRGGVSAWLPELQAAHPRPVLEE